MKTYSAKISEVKRGWWVIDATDVVTGRLASQIALILRGKHKPMFSPNLDCGDNIIVVNAEKIALTGKKSSDKVYYRHTGFPGGIKSTTPEKIMRSEHPERVLYKAVERMMPKGPLGRKQMSKLHVYAGAEHPHEAQKPEVFDFASKNSKNKRAA